MLLKDRMCSMCNETDIGDEFHYFLFVIFLNSRVQFLNPPNGKQTNQYTKDFAKFINVIMNVLKHP